VGIALSGEMAENLIAFLKVGDTVEFKCDISIDGDASKPILTLDSTMYQLMTDGQDASNTPGSSSSLYTAYDPKTWPVVSADRKKVWIVEVDGRQISPTWYSLGVRGYEMYRISKKLGGAWVTVMDGGGSSAMWVWNPASGSGRIVNRPSDSKGERSCMTYLLIREKQ
jgi:exopolysaccharide biosynthesis protein